MRQFFNYKNEKGDFELDYVIEYDGKIIGSIIYSVVQLHIDGDGIKDFICFGPVGIHPEYQGRGLGQKLIEYSVEKATKLGYEAIFITGNPRFYHRFGFESASR